MRTALILLVLVAPALAARLPYIIGGSDVNDVTKYPWQGALLYNTRITCGCALISNTWAVTAANCLGSSSPSYSVRFGSTMWRTGGQFVTLSSYIRHQNYGSGSGTRPNDIAVMHFAALTVGSTVEPISIASSDQTGNSDCIILGWGRPSVGGSGPVEVVKEARVDIYTNSYCSSFWGRDIDDGNVCAFDPAHGRGACYYDYGGPLACKVGRSYQLVGVSSWSVNGCYTSLPSIYTRLTYFRDWIRDKTGE